MARACGRTGFEYRPRRRGPRLGKHILDLGDQLKPNEQKLVERLTLSEAVPQLEEKGLRAVTAAKCLVAWSHKGQVRSEADFVCLGGVNPIPASSGKPCDTGGIGMATRDTTRSS